MATKPFVREEQRRSIGVSSDVVEMRTEERIQFIEDSSSDIMPELGLNLSGFESEE